MKPTQERIDKLMLKHGITLISEEFYNFAILAYEAGRKDENEACEKLHEKMWAASVSADSTVEAFNGALKNYARVIRARRGQ